MKLFHRRPLGRNTSDIILTWELVSSSKYNFALPKGMSHVSGFRFHITYERSFSSSSSSSSSSFSKKNQSLIVKNDETCRQGRIVMNVISLFKISGS